MDGRRTAMIRAFHFDMNTSKKITSAEFANLLRAWRADNEFSQRDAAQVLGINKRTLENWEQGRAKPNPHAALLIRLVEKYPDTVERLAAV